MGRLHDVYRAMRDVGGSLDMAFAQGWMLEMEGRHHSVRIPSYRRFCRRSEPMRERGCCHCHRRNEGEVDHRVFTFDDWGSGPQCVECGRLKERA